MLFVTNGDCAGGRIQASGLPGEILSWLDVLHEGPVPSDLSPEGLREVRARFIAERGWACYEEVLDDFARRDATLDGFRGHEEVVLWFEHDLYDQLQLIQLLDRFGQQDLGTTRLALICGDEYLGNLPPDRLSALFRDRHEVSGRELDLGHRARRAFTSPYPGKVSDLLREDTSDLPFLEGALLRHLQQFPSAGNGLSRSETQILHAVRGGKSVLRDVFVASSQEQEERIFLADSVFASYLEGLSEMDEPFLLFEDGTGIKAPSDQAELQIFLDRRAMVTEEGSAVLDGVRDRIEACGIDRWLGGVHLRDDEDLWRWDESARMLCRSAA